jgi:hypothetical protein
MNPTQDSTHRDHAPHVVVRPPAMTEKRPYRSVEILGTAVGRAYDIEDVAEFVRRAGLEDIDVVHSDTVAWEGGGPGFWGVDVGE